MLEIKDLIKHFESGAIGEIVKTQTTYLDIVCKIQSESSQIQNNFRIHFRGKREFLLDKDEFTQLQLFDEHPLLIDYIDPIVPIHLTSTVTDKQRFREELEFVTYQFFNGWRSFEDYLNMPLDEFLEKSYGIMMSAPQTFAEAVVQMAERNDIKLMVHKYDKDETVKPSVIFFNEYYVIADEFKLEGLE